LKIDQSVIFENDIFSNQALRNSTLGVNPIDVGLGAQHSQKNFSANERPGPNYPTSTSNYQGTSGIGTASKGIPPQPLSHQHQGPVVFGQQPTNTGYQGQPYQISPPYPGQHQPYPPQYAGQQQTGTSYSGQPTTSNPSSNGPSQQPQPAKTTSLLMQQPPVQQKPPTDPSSHAGAQQPLARRVTGGLDGAVNSSLLNQSLNTSIRMQKSQLKKMDQSILEAVAGKNAADDSDEIELNIDDNGFLIDDKGFPILNDKGEPMKLSEEQIEALKEQGLYEEKEVSTLE
jgi:hypothetical protein